MKVSLNNNIYLVSGAVYDCLYDLNAGKLYHMSKNATKFIKFLCCCSEVENMALSQKQIASMHDMIVQGILCTDDIGKCAPIVYAKSSQLETAWLEITQICNFRCVHCYEGKKNKSVMPLDAIQRIIDEFVENEINHIQIIGGEPFLHPDIIEVLSYCVGKFKMFSIYTNASVLPTGILTVLNRLDARVYVSLNSDVEEEFDKVTQTKNRLPVVKRNIDCMRKCGLDITVKSVKMSGVHSSPEYESFYGNFGGYPILVGDASMSQYDDEMLSKKVITKESFRGKLDPQSVMINMQEQYCFRNRIYVDVNGDVFPCAMERRVKHGNILRAPLAKMLDPSIIHTTKDDVCECKKCEYRFACNTCHVDTLSRDFYAKPWFCSYNPNIGEWQQYDVFIKELRSTYMQND